MTDKLLIAEAADRGGREEAMAVAEASRRGWSIERVALKNLRRGRANLQAASLVVGSVPFVMSALKVAGFDPPEDECYPSALRGFLHRSVRRRKLGQALSHIESSGSRLFVKPAARTKRFTGIVIDTPLDDRIADVPRSEDVWVGEPVEWLSEWRAYVINGEVAHTSFADGDRQIEPDRQTIADAAYQLHLDPSSPSACALDFGVMKDGRSALVEMNDGFSLGVYEGLKPEVYFGLLAARWEQIVGRDCRRGTAASPVRTPAKRW